MDKLDNSGPYAANAAKNRCKEERMPKNSRIFFLSLLILLTHVFGTVGNARALEYHATFGSLFHITSASAGLPDGFTAKPEVFVIRNDSYFRPIEVLASSDYFRDNPVNSIACQVKTPLMGGIYSLWLQPTDYSANPKPYVPILITDRFIVEEPVIESVLLAGNGNVPKVTLVGRFFGAAGIWIHLSNLARTNWIPCKIEWPYRFADAAAQPGKSCMNPRSGLSELSFFLPDAELEPGEYTIRLSNRTGIEAFAGMQLPQSKEELNVILAVSPTPLAGSTTPEAGSEFKITSGESIQIIATPSPNFTFGGWTAQGDVTFEDAGAPRTKATVYGDAVITANCIANPTLTLKVSQPGSGTTTPLPGQTAIVAPGESVEISASSFSGWNFAGWTASENASLGNNMALTTHVALTGDAEVTANFVKNGVSGVQFAGLVSAGSDTYDEDGELQSFIGLTWAPAICVDTLREDIKYLIYVGPSDAAQDLCQEQNLASSVTGALHARIRVPATPGVFYAQAVAVDSQGNTSIPRDPLEISVGEPMVYIGNLVNLWQLAGAHNYDEDKEIVTLKGDYGDEINHGDTVLVTPSDGPMKIRKVWVLYVDDNDDTVIWLEDGYLSDAIESGLINGSSSIDSSLKDSLSLAGLEENSDDTIWGQRIRKGQMADHRIYKDPENRILLIDRSPHGVENPLEKESSFRKVIEIAPWVKFEYSQNYSSRMFYSIPIKNRTPNRLTFNAKLKYNLQAKMTIDTTGNYNFEKKEIRLVEITSGTVSKEFDGARASNIKFLEWYQLDIVMDVKYSGKSDLKIVEALAVDLDVEVDFVWDITEKWKCSITGLNKEVVKPQLDSHGDFAGNLFVAISSKFRFEIAEDLGGWYADRNSASLFARAHTNFFNEVVFDDFTLSLGREINVFAEAEPFNWASFVLSPYLEKISKPMKKVFSLPRIPIYWDAGAPVTDKHTASPMNVDEYGTIPLCTAFWEDGVNNPIMGVRWALHKTTGGKMVEAEAIRGPRLKLRRYRIYPAVEPNPYELWVVAQYMDISIPIPDETSEWETYYIRARPKCPTSPFLPEKWGTIKVPVDD